MEHTDVHGNTLLHAATSSGNTFVVQFSLSTMLPHSPFHLNERNNYGETPLELATLKGWWTYVICNDVVRTYVIHVDCGWNDSLKGFTSFG